MPRRQLLKSLIFKNWDQKIMYTYYQYCVTVPSGWRGRSVKTNPVIPYLSFLLLSLLPIVSLLHVCFVLQSKIFKNIQEIKIVQDLCRVKKDDTYWLKNNRRLIWFGGFFFLSLSLFLNRAQSFLQVWTSCFSFLGPGTRMFKMLIQWYKSWGIYSTRLEEDLQHLKLVKARAALNETKTPWTLQ